VTFDVEFRDFTFGYEGRNTPALSNINLRIPRGQTVAIMGPAGAGKSTLLRCLNGFIPHFFRGTRTGQVLVNDLNTKDYDIPFLSHRVGLLFDDPTSQLLAPNVADEIAFGMENYGIPREQMVEAVRENVSAFRLSGMEHRNPHTLSGGQQQACALAAIMAMAPQILALDEPTSRLDPIGTRSVYSIVESIAEKKTRTILLADNKVEELVGFVDRIVVLNEGRVLRDGKPRDVLKDVDLIFKAGIRPPQVTELFSKIAEKMGRQFDDLPITLDEARERMLKLIERARTRSDYAHQSLKSYATEEVAVEAKDLWHVYPGITRGFEVTALKNINFKIRHGEFTAILGQNGSGKTTLVKHFNALLRPTKGSIFVYGRDTKKTLTAELAGLVGHVFQNPDHQIFARTVLKELEFGPTNLKVPPEEIKKRIPDALRAVDLPEDILDLVPLDLSTAQKQRVNIASVLMTHPRLLVVDEPTTGQDPQMRRELMAMMQRLNRDRNMTTVVITHDMNLAAEYCERCIVLRQGEILLDGTPREVFSQPQLLSTTFLSPPQVTLLSQQLKEEGFPQDVLSVDELVDFVVSQLGGR